MRLDKYLQDKFKLKSRTYAENLIKTGRVFVDGKIVAKTSFDVTETQDVRIIGDESYASQGAYKLEEAFAHFRLDVSGKSAADIGCSNGGFTDCLLRRGAASVLAVDVAECALPERLLNSGKVVFLQANARALPKDLKQVDFICSDVSFISLTYIMKSVFDLLKSGGEAVLLIKPQFELAKKSLNKKGVVTDKKDIAAAIEKVRISAADCGFEISGLTVAPVRFENKNLEYLLYLKKRP